MPILGVPDGAPSLTIAIWTGSIATIPTGWKLCDGTLGTPDLRNRFPKCVLNAVTNPGLTGGLETVTLLESQIPAHIHAFNISNHEHKGGDNASGVSGSPITIPLTGNIVSDFEVDISSSQPVGSITSTGNDTPHTNLPKCKDVLYIQKS